MKIRPVKTSSTDTSGDGGQKKDTIDADVENRMMKTMSLRMLVRLWRQESSRRKLCYGKLDIIRSRSHRP